MTWLALISLLFGLFIILRWLRILVFEKLGVPVFLQESGWRLIELVLDLIEGVL